MELSPKIGSATIVLGDMSDLDSKLVKLKAFYQAKIGSKELDDYRSVNLKYRNQIVCTKR